MKTVLGLLAILGLSISIAVASYGWKPSQENIAPLETAAQVVFPTRTPVPTITRTPSPTATSTPQPTATRTPFVQPTTDTTKIIEVAAAGATAQAIGRASDIEAQKVAWGWLAFAAMAMFAVTVAIAIVVAYIRSAMGHFNKAPQNDAQATTKAVETNTGDTPSSVKDFPPCSSETFEKWIDMVDGKTGKCPPEAIVKELFGGQDGYRRFFYGWMVSKKFAQKTSVGWVVTPDFYDWLEDLAMPTA